MNATEIKAKIEKIKNNKFFPEQLKAPAIKKLEDQLAQLEKKKAKKAKPNQAVTAKIKNTGKQTLVWEENSKSDLQAEKNGNMFVIIPDKNVNTFALIKNGRRVRMSKDISALKELAEKHAKVIPSKKNQKPKKQKKARKSPSQKLFNGKTLDELDEAGCEALLAAIKQRQETAAKASAKSASKPVIEKVAKNVTTAVKQAVNDVPAKDAKKQKAQFKLVISNAKKLMSSLRKLIADDTKKQKIEQMFKDLIDLINDKTE